MTTELIERLIKVLDKKLLPTQGNFLSGRLGILVQVFAGSYIVTVISKDTLHLNVNRLQDLKYQLGKDPFTDMEVNLYVNEMTELRDRNIRLTEFQIFVKEKDKK